jgi:hypothetical protein
MISPAWSSPTRSIWLSMGSLGSNSPPNTNTCDPMTESICDDRWRRDEDANSTHLTEKLLMANEILKDIGAKFIDDVELLQYLNSLGEEMNNQKSLFLSHTPQTVGNGKIYLESESVTDFNVISILGIGSNILFHTRGWDRISSRPEMIWNTNNASLPLELAAAFSMNQLPARY